MTDPQVLSTTTSATPIADSIPAPETGPVTTTEPSDADDHAAHVDWQPDIAALQAAKGDPKIWAGQFTELVGHTTGQWITESVFLDWLQLYSTQVATAANRAALFQVANTAVPADLAGDASLVLLAFRDQLAQGFRRSAGL